MCESNAYIDKEGKEELLLKDVTNIKYQDGKWKISDILGEQKIISAKLKEINLLEHKIIFEENL